MYENSALLFLENFGYSDFSIKHYDFQANKDYCKTLEFDREVFVLE